MDKQEFLRTLQGYRDTGANMLVPNMELWDPNGMYVPVIEAVTLDDNPKGADVYAADGGFRLHGHALTKIGNMANVQWDPINSCVVERKRGEYVLFRAVGFLQRPNGEFLPSLGWAEMDTDILLEDLKEEYQRKAAGNSKFKTEKQRTDYVNYCVDRDFRQKRRFLIPLAETRAKCRVIKNLLGIKGTYSLDELKRPFVTVWFRMDINYQDPEIRRMAAKAKIAASMMIFGFGRQQLTAPPEPAPTAPEPVYEPPIDPGAMKSANPAPPIPDPAPPAQADPYPQAPPVDTFPPEPPAAPPAQPTPPPAPAAPQADPDFLSLTGAQQTLRLRRLFTETGFDPRAEGLDITAMDGPAKAKLWAQLQSLKGGAA